MFDAAQLPPTIVGDATQDATLLQAGIARARAIVCALQDDADNLFVTLTARSLNRDLFIVSRARVASSEAEEALVAKTLVSSRFDTFAS